MMLTTVEGIYRNGHVELIELPETMMREMTGSVRVIVTFLPSDSLNSSVDLRSRKIDGAQAEELRARLQPFAAEWDATEMNIYDDYEANLANLSPR
jgi:hypothetical protein